LVTFERSGAILKNGKLIADDGTSYGVDGECWNLILLSPPN
jgi:hypothetical protein